MLEYDLLHKKKTLTLTKQLNVIVTQLKYQTTSIVHHDPGWLAC